MRVAMDRFPATARMASLLTVLLASSPVAAEEPAADDDVDDFEEVDHELASPFFSFHAYLNQAYAIATRNQIQGINKTGTSDYRTAALQFRIHATGEDNLVLQLAHKRIGASPIMEHLDEVWVDWAFYEHRFAPQSFLRVGRVQIPMGIYNELRDVGVVLPFYRVPLGFYGEGTWSTDSTTTMSETVDGVLFSHTLFDESDWPFTFAAYAGRWEMGVATGGMANTVVFNNATGLQLWLGTPLEGLRIGAHVNHALVENPTGGEETVITYAFSLDGDFQLLTGDLGLRVQSEFKDYLFPRGFRRVFYALVGVTLFDAFSINVLAERTVLKTSLADGPKTKPVFDEIVVGFNYAFSPSVVVKLEGHATRGFVYEQSSPSFLSGSDPAGAEYLITSLAVGY